MVMEFKVGGKKGTGWGDFGRTLAEASIAHKLDTGEIESTPELKKWRERPATTEMLPLGGGFRASSGVTGLVAGDIEGEQAAKKKEEEPGMVYKKQLGG